MISKVCDLHRRRVTFAKILDSTALLIWKVSNGLNALS